MRPGRDGAHMARFTPLCMVIFRPSYRLHRRGRGIACRFRFLFRPSAPRRPCSLRFRSPLCSSQNHTLGFLRLSAFPFLMFLTEIDAYSWRKRMRIPLSLSLSPKLTMDSCQEHQEHAYLDASPQSASRFAASSRSLCDSAFCANTGWRSSLTRQRPSEGESGLGTRT